MRKYTEEELKEMDKKADIAVKTMTLTSVGIGFAPVMVDVAVFMLTVSTGVVAVGKCYSFGLTKEDAGELIKQFLKTAGLTYSMIFAGQKLTTSLLKSNPVTYTPTMIVDAALCGATAYSLGSTSRNYFRRRAEGKKATQEEIRKWMKEGKSQGKKVAKKMAEEKA